MEGSQPFIMQGMREILDFYPEGKFLKQQVETIESAIIENPALVFDLAKSIVETVCKTILIDRGVTVEKDWSFSELINNTINNLRFLPEDPSKFAELRRSLAKTLSGLKTALEGIRDLRNAQGMASHGKDIFTPTLESIHAFLAAQTADAIAIFLFRLHKTYPQITPQSRIIYEDHSEFNNFVDEIYGVIKIFDCTFDPSRVLYEMDPIAYSEALNEYLSANKEE